MKAQAVLCACLQLLLCVAHSSDGTVAAETEDTDSTGRERREANPMIVVLFETTCLDISTQTESFTTNMSEYLNTNLPSNTSFLLELNCKAGISSTETVTVHVSLVGSTLEVVSLPVA